MICFPVNGVRGIGSSNININIIGGGVLKVAKKGMMMKRRRSKSSDTVVHRSPLHHQRRLSSHRPSIPFHLPVPMKIHCQRLHVIIESQLAHRPQHIFRRYRLSLLPLAPLVRFSRYEAYELRHALLYRLLRVV